MRYCYEHAVPHSQFLEWPVEDRGKLLAYMAEQALRCDMCGTADWEWDQDKFAYTPTTKFCRGCHQKAVASEGDSAPGSRVVLAPLTKQQRAKMLIKERKRAEERARLLREQEEEV